MNIACANVAVISSQRDITTAAVSKGQRSDISRANAATVGLYRNCFSPPINIAKGLNIACANVAVISSQRDITIVVRVSKGQRIKISRDD